MTAIRSLDRRAWLAIAVAVTVCVLFVHFSDAEAASSKPKVHFVRCAPGGVHAWVTEDGGIAVLPAGTECE